MKKNIILLGICAVTFTGCAVRDAIKETRGQITYIEKSNKVISAKIDSVAKVEKEDLNSTQAMTLSKFDELGNRLDAMGSKIDDMQQLYLSTSHQDKRAGGADSGKGISKNIFAIASSDFSQGNYELAIAGFQKYLSDLPNSAEAYYLLGESYYSMGKEDEAILSFQNLLQNFPVYPKLPTAIYKLCLIYDARHDTLSLQNCLTKLLENYPKAPESKLAKERFTKPQKTHATPKTQTTQDTLETQVTQDTTKIDTTKVNTGKIDTTTTPDTLKTQDTY